MDDTVSFWMGDRYICNNWGKHDFVLASVVTQHTTYQIVGAVFLEQHAQAIPEPFMA